MKLTELVDALAERSVQLRRDGDELVVRADGGKVEAHLVPGLREHKRALLDMLSRHGDGWWDPGLRITPEMLPLVQLTQAQIDVIVGATPGGAANIQDIYPLAPLQEGILFHHLMVETGDPYLQHALYGFQTRARLDEYAAALQSVIDRHDILRTAIHWEGLPDPVQVVQRRSALVVTEVDAEADGADAVEQLRARFDPRHFRLDIREAPMLRLIVVHDAANARWLSLMLFHHLCVDHTTIEVIQDEVAAFMLGHAGQLPTPLPFRNFVAQARLGVAKEEHEAFFREMLGDVDEPTTPYGLVDVQGDGRGIAEFQREVDAPLARRLRERARALGVSAASLVHVAWAQVLARVSGRDDVVFGTLMLGRMQGGSGADRVLGLFINTLPMRIHVGDDSAQASVRRTHALLTGLLRHEHAPLALAQRCSAVAAPAPLFSALLNYRHTAPPQAGAARNALGIEFLGGEERTNYPFTLSVDDLGEGFTLTAQVQAPAQPERVCEQMHTALQQLVQALETTPGVALRSLDVMPPAERHEQLVTWNETQANYPSGECLHWLVEAYARTQPQAPAVVHGERELSYAQLNAQANRLAHHLLQLGVKPGERVAILMARSIEIVVAELAVLKCAAVFVTLDQNAPDERQAFIVRDCEARVVLCAAGLALPAMEGVQRCDVEDVAWAALPSHDPDLRLDSKAPAHVTYTSGSTGNPKGVVVPHRAIGRVALNNGYADFRPSDRFAYVSNPAWDANTLEVWVPLLNGMCVVVFDQDEVLSPQRFREGLIRHRVNAAWLTVGLFNQYADALADVFGQLRFLLVGGDALDPRIVARVLRTNPPQNFINGYGPTETTVFAATHRLTEVPEGARSIPIGRPIANTRIYLLDRHLRPVPTGVVGEICIGGAGLACGYLNQPELTAERFVADPFRPGELMYRSGDLGRRLADGNIDFAGRNDFQVKVRGFRIELGEIEARLGEHPAIGEMAVLVREDEPGRKRIVAYYTSSDALLDAKALREHLVPRLPEYMLPAAYVRLDALPLTINGKLDRRALPVPDDAAIATSGYEAPVGEVEATVARIWAEELKLDRVGRNDNFFELGGHSLLAVRVIERMRQAGVLADVRVMFSAPTLSALADSVGGDHAAASVPANRIVPGCESITPDMLPLVALDEAEIARIVERVPGGAANVQDIYPLAPLQEGILFHHLLVKQGDPYLLHALLAFDSRERIERHVDALQQVVDRHDILRTAVQWEGVREPVQVVWRRAALAIEEVALDAAGGDVAAQLLARFDPRRHRIDIRQAPLLRIVVAHDAANSRWVMLQLFHHLAIDHTALEQAHAEVRAVLLGQGDRLPAPLPFRNFVAQTRLGVNVEEHEAFFRGMLHDVQEPTAPFGLVDARGDGERLREARLPLDEALAARLRTKARTWGVGTASVCHLAWAMVLARLSGRDDVVFGTVFFGRMQGGEGADRALGLFINTLPLRVKLDQVSVADGVRQVQALLAGLMRHEHASLAMAQRCSGVKAPTPLFSALLNYRHTPSAHDAAADEAWEGMEYLSSAERTNYPLALSVDDLGEGFELVAQAVAPIDAARVCAYMNEALEGLATAMESAPDMPLQAIDLLPSAERERVVGEWNATQSAFESLELEGLQGCVHELIEAQAARREASVAVSCEGRELSYGELNARANQLAHHLRRLGVGAEQRVAVCMQRSVEMVVALLAVWKAGGAYVPLDPAYPAARLAHMIGDSAPRALLCDRAVRDRIQAPGVPVIEVDAAQRAWERESRDNPRGTGVTPSSLAYVIYTSGSTGQPKGVMVEHRQLANLIGWHCEEFELKAGDRSSSVAGFGFDAVAWEMWPALSVGAQLCMPGPQCAQDPQALLAWWEQEALDVSFLPTPIAEHAFATGRGHPTLRRLLIGGDRLRQMPKQALGFELINNYGPTEATVVASSGVLPPGAQVLDIGRPIANTAIYLLDEQMRPVPQGVAGEIYIGGVQVARGYLNQPELTAERFVSDPFGGPGARMYRTGDLARHLEDGRIEFLGRNDAQVKVRGVRIELGEIEAGLLAHEAVREAVVVAREEAGDWASETRLVAYWTTQEGATLEAADLRQWLQRTLPQHMVPQAYVQLQALPLTANGKIDRRALPEPDEAAQPERSYEAPQGETETRLAQIWAEVLRIERVGRHDNFFELGGHSLSAVSMSSRAAQSFDVQIGLADLFAHPVLSDLAACLQSAPHTELPPLTRCRRDGPIPASFAQQRLWYLATMEGASHAYHVPLALRLKGVLDRAVLRRVFDRIVARHEALRTTFDMVDGRLVQRIAPEDAARVMLRESRLDRHAHADAELARLSMEEASAPFDLEAGPLMRVRLVVLGDEDHVLLLTLHHIVSDGWSIGVLVDELGALYAAYAEGRDDPLPPLAIQYADHAAWQRGWLAGPAGEAHAAYWREALAGAPVLLTLPTDHPRPARQDHAGATVPVVLDAALSAELRAFSRRHGVSLFMTLLAAWAIVMGRYAGQQDVVIGTPSANRRRQDIEKLIGFFVNTLAVRLDLGGNPSVAQFLERVKTQALNAQTYEDLPFEQVVELANPTRSTSHTPLFQVTFTWQGGQPAALNLPGLTLEPVAHGHEAAKYDLSLLLAESGEQITGGLVYASALFERATAERFVGYLRHALRAMLDDDATKLDELALLGERERERLLVQWNATETEYPRHAGVHELFEEQVRHSPKTAAVVDVQGEVGYGELNAQANRLARRLRALGVKPGDAVAVLLERSSALVAAYLGILKCGAVYVPLDEHAPATRQRYMLADCAARVVLTREGTALPEGHEAQRLNVEAEQGDEDPGNERVALHGLSPAYIMYTSGSSGQPKGVIVPHRAIARLVLNNGYAQLLPGDRVAMAANPAFDASTLEVWGPLLNGGTAVVVDQDSVLQPQRLKQRLRTQGVNVLWLTVGLFNQMAQELADVWGQLRYLIVGGDALDANVIRRVLAEGGPRHLLNGYGPTESTTFAITCEIEQVAEGARSIPIGRPIANTRVYILDGRGQPVPQGAVGEIHIAGDGLALGYLNQPQLTSGRFVADPHGLAGERMYKTGDLGRYLEDGNIEFLGRNDQQVKIRGFRIELGEIEARLSQCEGVREAVVLAREDSPGDKRLVAYVVGDEASSQALREQLAAQLPEYMVPAAYVKLEQLPLTPNGKVDRKALPAPDGGAYVERGYEAPEGEVETTLARIWAEVLKLEQVGRHDNFFELGGHSLLAVSVLGKMRRQGLHSDVGAMFAAPTLAALAATLDAVGNDVQVPVQVIPPGCENITPAMLPLVALSEEQIGRIVAAVPGGAANLQDVYPLAPLQEGIFFHHLMSEEGDPYLDHMMFTCSHRDRVERLAQALQVVVDRHDILRTAVVWEDVPEPVQVVWRQATLEVENVSLDPAAGDIARQLHARFDPRHHRLDLRRAPMMRLAAAHDPVHDRWVVLWLFHHLLVDHTAIELMQHEMEAHLMGRLHELPAPVSYRNFVAQARHGMSREAHEAFFREMLGDVDEPTAPYGVLDVHGDGGGIVEASRQVDAALGHRLRERARILGVSTAALCHLAWAMVLRRLSGRDDVVFATVLFGRMHSGDGAERAVGLFINTLPLRVRISSRTAYDSARDTHEALAQLMRHEHAPLSLAQRCSGVALPTPLFSTLLNCRRVLRSPQAGDERAQLWEGIEFLSAEERTNYPICLNLNDTGEGFHLNAQVQAPMDAQRICDHLHQALEGLVDALEHSPGTPVRRIDVLPPIEREQLLARWNATRTEFPQERCIHELFEAQVAQRPDAVAIVHGDEVLSYRALNERANRLAHHLRAVGVVHDARVAVCLQRGVDMVVALLATLKAGGAYLPLDPAFPIDRIVYTCRDAAPVAVLTHRAAGDEVRARMREALSAQACAPVFIDVVEDTHRWSGQPAASLAPARPGLTPRHLAQLIYTSGSTGQPKGVMMEHVSVVNTLAAMGRLLRIEPSDRVLALATVAFDIAGLEIFLPLTSGACIVMADRAHGLDPASLADLLVQQDVTLMQATPTTWRMLLDSGWHGSPRLRALSGGEALSADVAARLLPRVDAFWNAYGPTETTIYSTAVQVGEGGRQTWEPGSIGRPLANTRLYVLDTHQEPLPVGVVGELYIGGTGVARGYLNQPGLSAERFIDDPFAGEADARMYKTGDLARYRPDGSVEFVGRNDFQVKIRGFRIELGEIEARLAQHPQVRQAVVLAREIGGDHRLVAYVVGDQPDAQALRTHLLACVPEYMVPAAYVRMDALPLTPNGKIDRKALPAPDSAAYVAHGNEAPVGETETLLAGLWAQVLGIDRVGRHDNFFELGGHSLLAVSLMERMRQAGLPADVRRLFGHPTVAALAASMGDDRDMVVVPPNRIAPGCEAITPDMLPLVELGQAYIDSLVATVPGGAANVQDIYPLAPLQEGILFHHLMGGPGDAYLLPAVLAFDTRARLDQYLGALQAVVDRHDVLRTAVHWDDLPQPVQVVWRQACLSVEEVAVDASAGDAAAQLRERFHPSRFRVPLDQAPLLRVFIAPDAANGRWVMLLLFHHLCADHTTLGIVQHEIEAHLLGTAAQLPAPQPFRNHVAQARLGVSNEEHETFFRAMLADVDEATAPYGLTEVLAGGFEVSEAHAQLDDALAQRLRDCARAAGVSLATVCHLAWAQVLSRLSDRDDVVFGTVLFGRMHGGAGSDRATGMFINTLPIRLRVGEVPAREAVQQAHALLTQLLRHEHAPLALAQRCSGVSAPAPLFSALLNYRHSPVAAHGEADAAASRQHWSGIEMLHMEERTNYPLCLNVDDLGVGVLLTAQTPKTLDPARVCAYMEQALEGLAAALESAPHALLRDIDVLSAQERAQLLNEWSVDAAQDTAEVFAHEMVELRAAQTPLQAAVVHDGRALSYAELNTQANRLARHLRRLGVQRDSRVAMCVERSADMVVGLLATLKAGAAYVPLDPGHPVERLAHMVGDSAPALVLTHAAIGASARTRLLQALEARCPSVAVLDLAADAGRWADEAGDDLGRDLVQMRAEDMAYVVYTSGSTGVPKGVVNTIAGLGNRLAWFADSVLQAPPVTAFKTTIGFVDSVTETLQTLAAGGTLVVMDGPTAKDPLRLAAEMQRGGVDTLVLVPSLLAGFMQVEGSPLASLKTLVCSGERLQPALMHEVMARYPGLRLFNFYGSSEVNGEATAFDCRDAPPTEGSVIGRPIANMRVYLLDHAGRPVPAGAVGELYVGGPGLARGYLNRPDLTAERFIANPFGDGPQDRLFKTGDLGRHRPDGSIEYLGRNDFQVKIRGQRVELGEIEQQLLRHGAVCEAVVLAREDVPGDQRLVAYLVADEAIDARAMREHLSKTLPDHMVPAAFVPLDALPMTASGKIDRRALPAPDGQSFVARSYEPPVGEVEALLARIWADVLKIERVGRHDNFFELGGHSLLAMNATARMRSVGLHAEMSAFFTAPTLAAFVHATQVEWEVSL